jgi:formyltetrahydrofolate deformylase
VETILLTLSCADRVGLLAETTGFCASRGLNLLEAHQFTDAHNSWFFTRLEMEPTASFPGLERLRMDLAQFASGLGATWMLRRKADRHRVALLVSREGHCLADLLWRWRSGDLAMDPAGVISNHLDLEPVVTREGLPFVHVPFGSDGKKVAFAAIQEQLADWSVDTVVLARFMQIIPPELCGHWSGRMINIHHSFLPAFAGAQPYRQAHERGVKLIGATCHYVTPELDAGPIIDQEVTRVEHFHSLQDLVRLGQDCERLALLRGLRYHLEDRVFVHRGRTIVFRD